MLRTFCLALFVLSGFITLSVSASSAKASDDFVAWQKEVVKALVSNQRYPRSAAAQQIEGLAKVEITVAKDGSITRYVIIQETGFAVLDREIPKLFERIGRLPAIPGTQQEVRFVLPISWSLS